MKALGVKQNIKLRSSLRVPSAVIDKVEQSMLTGNYGPRNRSRWICEAIEEFIKLDAYWELIAEVFMDSGNNQIIPITLDGVSNKLLTVAENKYLNENLNKSIDKSDIIRAAIMKRLINEYGGAVF